MPAWKRNMVTGWLAVGAALALGGSLFLVKFLPEWRKPSTVFLEVQFPEAAGLIPGNQVRIRGAVIGRVTNVSLEGKNATVRIEIPDSVTLNEGTRFVVSERGFLGGNYLEIIPGKGKTTEKRKFKGEAPLNLSEAIGDILSLFTGTGKGKNLVQSMKDISKALSGREGVLGEISAEGSTLRNKLEETGEALSKSKPNVFSLLFENEEFSTALNEIEKSLSETEPGAPAGVLFENAGGDNSTAKNLKTLKRNIEEIHQMFQSEAGSLAVFNAQSPFWKEFEGFLDTMQEPRGLAGYLSGPSEEAESQLEDIQKALKKLQGSPLAEIPAGGPGAQAGQSLWGFISGIFRFFGGTGGERNRERSPFIQAITLFRSLIPVDRQEPLISR